MMRLISILVACFFATSAQAKPIPESFANIIEELTPAVVNISTTQKPEPRNKGNGSPMQAFPPNHPFAPFNDFFERFGPPGGGGPFGMGRELMSLGSGFIIDPEGYVVTNYHVIEGADIIKVNLADDTKHEAEIVGTDRKTDLALLKIKTKKKLPYIKFGDSDTSRVGDWVLAIGNPFGLGGTVTAGIISATSRDINSGPFDDFIQTDAAINRGNSGGPLFDLEGNVIGVNTAIYSPSGGGNVGIGFAVPANLAAPVIEQLKDGGKVQRGWLGVKIQRVTDAIAESLALDEPKGALVAEVLAGSPAEKAGLKSGDVIIEFDGNAIDEMRTLPRVVALTEKGKKVSIKVLRAGDIKMLKVKVGELDENAEIAETEDQGGKKADDIAKAKTVLGIMLAPLDDRYRDRFSITPDIKGLVVLGMQDDSPALSRGIRAGDVVTEINQEPVRTVKDAKEMIKKAKKKGRKAALFLVSRDQDSLFIALPIDE